MENLIKELKEENKKLLILNDQLEHDKEMLNEQIYIRDLRIHELEKGMEEALADLTYVL